MDLTIKVSIAPLQDVDKCLKAQRYGGVISILGISDQYGRTKNSIPWPNVAFDIAHLRLNFDDVMLDTVRGGKVPAQFSAPKVDHCLDLIRFLEQNGRSDYLIHCRAGVSRSVAVAIAVLSFFGASAEQLRTARYLKNYFKPSAAFLSIWDTMSGSKMPLLPLALEKRAWDKADEWSVATFELKTDTELGDRHDR